VFEDFEMPMAGGRERLIDRTRRLTVAPVIAEGSSVRVATYNIHTCIGVDRRYDPGRIATVLCELDADIVCLQEVGARRGSDRHHDQWAYLGEVTGRRVITGMGIRERLGRFGNAILTRFPVLTARAIDLSVSVRAARRDRCRYADWRPGAARHRHPFRSARC
jgi:endonuclease/exonuclease/phosphatase family metal-dependent hydrolase